MSMSSKSIRTTRSLLQEECVRRLVTGSTIAVGSLYDIRSERIVGKLQLGSKATTNVSQQKDPECEILKNDSFHTAQIHRRIGMHDEPWLNVLLNIIPAHNMNALINYSPDLRANTRYLYFYHCSQEQTFSITKTVVHDNIPKSMPDEKSTHIVSAIRCGIQVLIVLHLPPAGDEHSFDRLLDKVKQQLIRHKYETASHKKNLLNQITVVEIFSNMSALDKRTAFIDLCQKITNISSNKHCHHPIDFTLRSIMYFYPSYPAEKMGYSLLEPHNVNVLKQNLISLRIQIDEFEVLFDSKRKSLSDMRLRQQYEVFQQRLEEVKKMYSEEIEYTRDSIAKVRATELPQKEFMEILFSPTRRSCKDLISALTEDLRNFDEKQQLVSSDQQVKISISPTLSLSDVHVVPNIDSPRQEINPLQPPPVRRRTIVKEVPNDTNETDDTTEDENCVAPQPTPRKGHLSEPSHTAQISPSTNELNATGKQCQQEKPTFVPTPPSESKPNSTRPLSGKSIVLSPSHEPEQIHKNFRTNSSENVSSLIINTDNEDKQLVGLAHNQSDHTNQALDASILINSDANKSFEESNRSPLTVSNTIDVGSKTYDSEQNLKNPSLVSNHQGVQQVTMQNEASLIKVSTNKSEQSTPKIITPSNESCVPSLFIANNDEQTKPLSVVNGQITVPSEEHKVTTHEQLNSEENNTNGPVSEELPSPKDINYINVLLLGESGVGKSTFINALANYHTFGSFQEARTSPPLVVLPVSFLMTTGDDFQEKIVHFGDIDSNEDHNTIGQSVTQHCQSYVFPISDQTKLRLIDTPGMGDTRGIEQDDKNMEHMISYISNLSHLNGICILLKPNESRLNVVLRSYFTRLLNFIGENARHSIVFCFTNTRSTFYAPGNTGPLLRKMLADLPNKNIKFEKTNTFCFDSEAFRYLIASGNGIEFDTYQQKEYEQSWKKSSEVSNDLIDYICATLKPYSQNQWHSMESLQFQVKLLIRPLLETTRNTLRNIILLDQNSSKLIKLCPTPILQPSSICYKCKRHPKSFESIWIYLDDLHTLSDSCGKCSCEKSKHVVVDYELQYDVIEYNYALLLSENKDNLLKFQKTILKLGKFYGYIVGVLKKNDFLLPALRRMVAEETEICSQKGQNCFNIRIRDKLNSLVDEYVKEQEKAISIGVPVSISDMFQVIDDVYEIDDINAQINVVKRTQENYIKKNEKEVFIYI